MNITKTFAIFWIVLLSAFDSYSFNIDTTSQCDKIERITKQDYEAKFIRPATLDRSSGYSKTGEAISIRTKSRTIIFKNEFEGNELITSYKVYGQLKSKHWVFVECMWPNTVSYYMINTRTSKVDTLIGKPRIFGNEMVCVEGAHTDSPRSLEVYSISAERIILKFKMSLSRCGDLINADRPYLLGKKIFLTDLRSMAWAISYE